jgi:hypothetical protein
MRTKTVVSISVTLLIAVAVAVYLIALDNRYKQIYGKNYFDIWTGKTVKVASSGAKEIIVEYPWLKSQYKLEVEPDFNSSK